MDHETIMRRVIALSETGMRDGHGGPFGCVVTRDGVIVAEAHNEVLSSLDPTAHAETLAIRRASAALKTFDLSACAIHTIGAPCCMCASAMLWAGIKAAYYIVSMAESEAIGLGDTDFYEELGRPMDERRILPMIHCPDLSSEARAVYQAWLDKPDRITF